MEYLDGDGNWRKFKNMGLEKREYLFDFKKLDYNFMGGYNFYISKTKSFGYEVIFRKKMKKKMQKR